MRNLQIRTPSIICSLKYVGAYKLEDHRTTLLHYNFLEKVKFTSQFSHLYQPILFMTKVREHLLSLPKTE